MYYRGIVNQIAYNRLTRVPEIPDFHLMVGAAEAHYPVPVLIYKDVPTEQAKALIRPINEMKREEVDLPLQGTTYTTDDFVTNTFYLGAPIDGGL